MPNCHEIKKGGYGLSHPPLYPGTYDYIASGIPLSSDILKTGPHWHT